jgi:chorismate mutase / prephenate dehydratase
VNGEERSAPDPYGAGASNKAVHFLGPEGTFAHAATLKAFGLRARLVPEPDILAVFEALAASPHTLGVVPIENSTEGGVNLTLEALFERPDLHIVGEIVVDVEQCLLGRGPLDDIQVVYSHAHGLAQCTHWLRAHLPHAKRAAVGSTALGATLAAETPHSAAIASELAGKLANLPVLFRGVQDRPFNATRFFVVSHEPSPNPTGRDKTSLAFGAPHRRGALHQLLGIFAAHGINLSRIESRPMPGHVWQYIFFVDIEGHQAEPHVAAALQEVEAASTILRIMGSYPAALRRDTDDPPSI